MTWPSGPWIDGPRHYPPALLDREQWMGRKGKLPFAPWGDPNAPARCRTDDCPAEYGDAPECDCDARFKWGYGGHYRPGDYLEEYGEAWLKRGDIDGRAFIQLESDPFAFVDGDDVRDPETGDVHPAFRAFLEHLGATYADISTSGAGVHACYHAPDGLPFGERQATFPIDTEPWGSNDDIPTIEIYANKHVCVTTGSHVDGTPDDVQAWDADALRAILEANGYGDRGGRSGGRSHHHAGGGGGGGVDLSGYDPNATTADETAHDIRDVFAAVDRIAPSDLPLRTRRVGSDATGWDKFDPSTYRSSESGESLHYNDDGVFYDHKHGQSFGVLRLFAAERGILSKPWDRLDGPEWWDAVEAARDAGASIPEYDGDDDATPTAPIATARIEAIQGADRERAGRRDAPSTREARKRLRDAVLRELRAGNTTVLDAPTALGKTHTVATEPWCRRADVTGEAPVVHLHATRDARDDALEKTEESAATGAELKGRQEISPVARGDHDDEITIDGEPASEWFDTMCDEKGLPFSSALALATHRNDQGLEELPPVGEEDPAVAQWDGVPRDDGEPAADVVHATHQFAYVPSLRANTNVIIDEQPDYSVDLAQDRVRRMVGAYLREIDAPVSTWEAFIGMARYDGYGSDAATERRELARVIGDRPRPEWFVEHPDAHGLAPSVTKAIWYALRDDDGPDANGRCHGTAYHQPPRLDADDAPGMGSHLSVVIDEDNDIRQVRQVPDFGQARAVIGLDAHPAEPVWDLNVTIELRDDIEVQPVLNADERRLWRRYERGLTVVQIGDATRPRSGSNAREWMNEDRVEAVVDRIDQFDGGLSTAVTTRQVEPAVRDLIGDDAETMHYGEEKSRNDFAGESVGYVYGCMDPGDDMILDALAELGLDATPVRLTEDDVEEDGAHECHACGGDGCDRCDDTGLKREKGRTFDGPDADTAADVLASVRENRDAQGAGRYARNPDDPEDCAVVFVDTDATPDGLVDIDVPGVEWVATELQSQIIDELSRRRSATCREIGDAVGTDRSTVWKTLTTLEEKGVVERREGAGDHGADVWHDRGVSDVVVDLGETVANPLYDLSRWVATISERHTGRDDSTAPTPTHPPAARADGGVRTGGVPPDG